MQAYAAAISAITSKCQDIVRSASASTKVILNVVRALSNGLARMAGPKTVVFLSDGFILQQEEDTLRDATGMANRAGAHFYTIDARGLNKGSASSAIIDQAAAFDSGGPSNRFDMQEDGINALAVDTGGIAIHNENNFGRALDLIQHDAATYYVIGYTPANQTFDGKYRKIDTSVNRPGVKVRARRGYLALEPAKLLKPVSITASGAGRRHAPRSPSRIAGRVRGGRTGRRGRHQRRHGDSGDARSEGASDGHRVQRPRAGAPGRRSGSRRARPTISPARGGRRIRRATSRPPRSTSDRLRESPRAHPWVRYALGLSHLALAQYAEAVAAWEAVRRSVPEFEPVYFNLADGYMLQKDNDAALKVLRDAQERWPNDSEVWNATGVLEVRRGAIDAAIRSFTRATSVAPAESLGFFNLARAYQMRAAQSQRFDSTMQKWVGGEGDSRKAVENYTKYVDMGGPFVQQAKQALQVLNWK